MTAGAPWGGREKGERRFSMISVCRRETKKGSFKYASGRILLRLFAVFSFCVQILFIIIHYNSIVSRNAHPLSPSYRQDPYAVKAVHGSCFSAGLR